jgi:hypothetical protein
MPRIVETIVTTLSADGEAHIAPLGLIAEGERWVIAPFHPSRTLDNLRAVPFAVASHTDDVRVFAGCLTGRKSWPTRAADKVQGVVLEGAVSHWELAVEAVTEDELRPRFACRVVHTGNHRAWEGFNRAQAAVLECAVLVSRLKMLPPEKMDAELKYLEIAISKTAGPREAEAWGWLMARIDAWRAEKAQQV